MCSDVLRCSQMFSDDHRCFWIFSRYSIDVLLMFSRCSQDICRIFPGCFHDALMGLVGLVDFDDHFKWKYGQWTLMVQRNSMIPSYLTIPGIWWSIGSMDFDNPKVYGDTSISDGLVLNFELPTCKSNILSKIASSLSDLFSQPNYLTYLITHK